MPIYSNTLELNHRPKDIPYGGTGELREDGDANYGFKYIKGNEQLLLQIPELQRDAALFELVRAINDPVTGLFTIGCVSDSVEDSNGFRRSGYVEFAINSASSIADASNYFPVFFHFDRGLHQSQFPVAVAFAWELQPCTFTAAGASGFTCSIIINTHHSQNREEAWSAWSNSLAMLASYLKSVPPERQDFLYQQ